MTDSQDLNGKLLIAMPGMGDPRFDKSVVFICDHSSKGSMGLIVNKPAGGLHFAELIEQLGVPSTEGIRDIPVHFGGPVEHGRGFVLHSADFEAGEGTMRVDDRFGMTATLDILEQLASGAGPERAIFALGYSGWGPGQLEGEILRNGWLTCDAAPELVFGKEVGAIWGRALKTLGVDPLLLSASAGRA